MYKARYFNNRYLNSYYFNGGPPYAETRKAFFSARTLTSKFFSGLQFFSRLPSGPAQIPAIVSSIAIEVLPSSVPRNSPVTIIAYVYDQFNKPMQGVEVSFGSSTPTVLSVPSSGATDLLGRVVKQVVTTASGTTNLSATVLGFTAYTVVTVTSVPGGVTSTLTHGATIQPGNAGGGSPGPIRVKLIKRVKRWPTR